MVGRALTSEGSFLARLGIGSPGQFLTFAQVCLAVGIYAACAIKTRARRGSWHIDMAPPRATYADVAASGFGIPLEISLVESEHLGVEVGMKRSPVETSLVTTDL